MQYRNAIHQVVEEVVRNQMDKTQAVIAIRNWAIQIIAEADRNRFIELVERELQSLHEGNIARYHLRIGEYETWKKNWR